MERWFFGGDLYFPWGGFRHDWAVREGGRVGWSQQSLSLLLARIPLFALLSCLYDNIWLYGWRGPVASSARPS